MGRTGRLIVLVLLLLASASAAATPVSGQLVLDGALQLPRDSSAEATPTWGFLNNTSEIHSLLFSSPRVLVTRYEIRPLYVTLGGELTVRYALNVERATYELRNVTAQLDPAGEHAGWVGFYPTAETRLHLSGAHISARAANRTTLGNALTDEAHPPGESPWYRREANGPHVVLEGAGSLRLEGGGAWKFQGLDLIASSETNTSSYPTYAQRDGGLPAGEARGSWQYWEWDDATLRIETASPLQITAPEAEVTWDGPALLEGAQGALATRSARYDFTTGPTTLDGAFSADLVALGGSQALLSLQGEMRGASALPGPTPTVEPSWTIPAALAALLIVALTAFVAYRYGVRHAPALTLLALRARFRKRPGEAELRFAALHASVSGDLDVAEKYALIALRTEPRLALELDEAFESIRQRPSFRAAVDDAMRRANYL